MSDASEHALVSSRRRLPDTARTDGINTPISPPVSNGLHLSRRLLCSTFFDFAPLKRSTPEQLDHLIDEYKGDGETNRNKPLLAIELRQTEHSL